MTEKNEPIKKIRAGLINLAIWQNKINKDGREFVMNNVTINRSYKDKDGSWKETQSFGLNDLQRVKLCIEKALEYLLMKEEQETEEKQPEQQPAPETKEEPVLSNEEKEKYRKQVIDKTLSPQGYQQLVGEAF